MGQAGGEQAARDGHSDRHPRHPVREAGDEGVQPHVEKAEAPPQADQKGHGHHGGEGDRDCHPNGPARLGEGADLHFGGIAPDHPALQFQHGCVAERDGEGSRDEAQHGPAFEPCGRRAPPGAGNDPQRPHVGGRLAPDGGPKARAQDTLAARQQGAGEEIAPQGQDGSRGLIKPHGKELGPLHGGVGFLELLLQTLALGGHGGRFRGRLVGGLGAKLLQLLAGGVEFRGEVVERRFQGAVQGLDIAAQLQQGGVAKFPAAERLLDLLDAGAHAIELLRRHQNGGRRLREGEGGAQHKREAAQKKAKRTNQRLMLHCQWAHIS